MKNGALILWNAVAICEMFVTSWQMGKLLRKGDPCGAMVEYYPLSSRHQSRLHQFSKNVSPGSSVNRGRNLERRYSGRSEEFENMDAPEILEESVQKY